MNKLSIGQVWEESAAFLRAERRLLVPLALATLVLPAAVLTLVMPTQPGGAPMTMADRPEPGPWMIVGLVALAVMLVGQLAISRLALGWHGSLADALRHGARRFVPMFAANLMLAVAVVFPLILILTVIQLAAPAAANVALVVLTIPLLMLFIRASLSLPVAAGETLGPVGILRRAFTVSRGSSLRLLGFALLFIVAAMVVAGALSAVIGTLVIALLGKPDPWTVSATLLALVAGLIQAVIIALWSVMLARIYAQLAREPVAA